MVVEEEINILFYSILVQGIKIRTAGRPAVLRDQVVEVVLEPLDGHVGDMAGGQEDGAFHDLQKDVRVDPEASLQDVRGPS